MNTSIIHELFEKLSKWYCFYVTQKELHPDAEVYSVLAEGARIQMVHCYTYLYGNVTHDMFAEELRESIETFLKTAEKVAVKEGRDAEKIAVRARDCAKMSFMMLTQQVKGKTTVRNTYVCRECGWAGMDEIPDKCPLCGKKL